MKRSRLTAWLCRNWPRCVPYDSKFRLCLREKDWNGRCMHHFNKAIELGEEP